MSVGNGAPPRAPRAGFTLVELMLSLALTGALMALALPFLHTAKRLWERAEGAREARRTLDAAAGWIARDLRQAGYHVPGPALREIGEGSLAYVLSRDEDEPAGFSSANRRLVTVFVDEGDLKYRVQAPAEPPATGWESGSTQVLVPGVAGLACRGTGAGGAESADPAAVRLVTCTISAARGGACTVAVRLRTPGEGPP